MFPILSLTFEQFQYIIINIIDGNAIEIYLISKKTAVKIMNNPKTLSANYKMSKLSESGNIFIFYEKHFFYNTRYDVQRLKITKHLPILVD